ncbi:MAG: GvpL/GvpF family gas vesicle protein [Deltaproteobacteria bacterium]|nr:GvpL/GvpF family gas vesicle protein [Deltaproteobacteria bacterium]MBI4795042.1 GvpL/GvpF family gas vesicle protein [Deltaproteobacteria bacterium]
MPRGLYLFCLARLSRLPFLPLEGQGLDGQSPLEVADFQDLAAVWSPVPVEDFSGPDAAERLRDLAWIGPRVIRHQEVVARVMRHSPVLPARFGTIFSSAEKLEKLLQYHHDTINKFLERVAGQEEWAVKGLLNRSGAKEKLFSLKLAREAGRLRALSPGKRYFQEQRLRAAGEQELQRWLQAVCRELLADLRDFIGEVRERQLLSREATGHNGHNKEMVLNWAFLVPKKAAPSFRSRIREANARHSPRGLVIECTGPWPPYSFTPALDLEPGG